MARVDRGQLQLQAESEDAFFCRLIDSIPAEVYLPPTAEDEERSEELARGKVRSRPPARPRARPPAACVGRRRRRRRRQARAAPAFVCGVSAARASRD
jgi:hypothetical protein